ncbi:MAG: type II toxin-antitoxin system Phd/YefM family antitoxin [Cyanobacteria bacterium P01_A01_bin.3]
MLVSKTESATNARKEFFKILDEVANDSSVVIVKRKDAPNVAIIAESELSGLMETVHLLRSPQNAQRLFAALDRSQTRDLDTPEAIDPEQVKAELRQYCEQKEEANTVEIVAEDTSVEPAS